ncbi:MAG: hypothetical protein H6Q78_1197, partial [Candidatus Krumholzibacteriota bacterium]|nr:hypothetical protein [Candidatus Krumholzibacteriota bacterium]
VPKNPFPHQLEVPYARDDFRSLAKAKAVPREASPRQIDDL